MLMSNFQASDGGVGRKMVRTLKGVMAIALLLGFAAAAQAAGLGKLTVTSALGNR